MSKFSKKTKKHQQNKSITIDDIPSYILEYVKNKSKSKPLFGSKGDLDELGNYTECWLVALDDGIVITEGVYTDKWVPSIYAKYNFLEIKELKVENYTTTGAVVCTFKSCQKCLLNFTNTCLHKMIKTIQLTEKLRKKEKFTTEDYLSSSEQMRCPECGRLYPDKNRPICPKCIKKSALFVRVLKYTLSYKIEIVVVTILTLLMSVIGIISPYINGVVLYDDVLTKGGKYYGQILPIVIIIICLSALRTLAWVIQGRINAKLAAKIIYDIKNQIFTAMQKLSLSFYNGKQTGSLMTRINNDAMHVQYFLNDGLPFFAVNFLTLVVMTIVMFTLSVPLTLLVFIPVPLVVYIIKVLIPKFFRLKWRTFVKTSKLNSLMGDSFTAMRVVKAFGKEDAEGNRFDSTNSELYTATLRAGRQGAVTFPALGWVMGIGSLFIAGYGGWSIFNGTMTFGVLMTFINFTGYLYGPINYMLQVFNWWTDCMNSAQRIFEVIDRTPDIREKKKPVKMPSIKGRIQLNNITFEYEPNKPILHKVNLTISEGEMIGLVGHSGAGKSTITNLITRLYDVTEGEISIDGINIKDIKISDLRGQIGMVLQDTFLFSGTIAENIAYAKLGATREEIISAAKLANAHDFIMRLPDGYETELGKRQMKLSGGEQQRISIARAILVNPRILILDEATASVDTETEQQIQEALERLVKGRTTIAIAHRLSTLRNANRLVVVEKGKIEEIGTHKELEDKKGIYYKMLSLQKEALKIRGAEN